ncbi:hypothetical protein SAMN05444161_4210 [Rhizobiales bacterium GAS191]|nr:hypothetical protein SAMN05444161_4210 [Rhizobiales bacterium GAS191]
MTVNIEARRKDFMRVVAEIADEQSQRRAWFGHGLEVASPDEQFNMFFDDLAAEEFLSRKDNGFIARQQQAAQILYNLMDNLADALPKKIDPKELIDDPRWIAVRAAAAQLLALI